MMTITIHLLIALFTNPAPAADFQDLCDVVNPDTGVPTRCEIHPEGAPEYGKPICCDDASCYPYAGGCPDSMQAYSCELGEVLASDEVACYFEVPDYCDSHPCEGPGYGANPQDFPMCCHMGICYDYFELTEGECELDDIFWCSDGVCNDDGTVTCFD